MYETFFQLKEPPFNLTPDPQFFYLSRQHEEALAHLSFGVRERKGFMVLTGEVGTGKTTLSRLFLNRLTGNIRTSLIFNPSVTSLELLRAINQDFGIPADSDSKKELVDRLNDFLLKEIASGGNAVLLVDEAQNLPVECVEEIRLLSNLETEKEKLLQVIMVGQPELQAKLNLPELRQFNQRVSLRYHLQPLGLDEMEGYILYRLRMAGGPGKILFSREAMQKIYAYSQGFPRLINLVCDKALLAAYVEATDQISGRMTERAIQELTGRLGPEVKGPGRAKRINSVSDSAVVPIDYVSAPAEFTSAPSGTEDLNRNLTQTRWFWSSFVAGVAVIMGVGIWIGGQGRALQEPQGRTLLSTTIPQGSIQGRFDADGVYRVASAKDSLSAAFLTLMKLWGAKVPSADQAFQGMGAFLSPVTVGASQGFITHVTALDLKMIHALDYPVLVSLHSDASKGGDRYGVLSGLNDREAIVLDPILGKTVFDTEAFMKMARGEGYIWWRAAGGVRFPYRTNDWDISIERLQGILKDWGYYQGTVDGFTGTATRDAVSSFWKEQGFVVDKISPEIFMAVSKRLLGGKTPSLRERAIDGIN